MTDCRVTVRVLPIVAAAAYGGPIPDAITALCRMIATSTRPEARSRSTASTGSRGQAPVTEASLREESGVFDSVKMIGSGTIADRLLRQARRRGGGLRRPPRSRLLEPDRAQGVGSSPLRLALGDDPARRDALVHHLRAAAPWGVQVEIEPTRRAWGTWSTRPPRVPRPRVGPRRRVRGTRWSRWAAAARFRSCRCSPRPSPGMAVLIWRGRRAVELPLARRERRPRRPRAARARRGAVHPQPRRRHRDPDLPGRRPGLVVRPLLVGRDERRSDRHRAGVRTARRRGRARRGPQRRRTRRGRGGIRRSRSPSPPSCSASRAWCANCSMRPGRPRSTKRGAHDSPRSISVPSANSGKSSPPTSGGARRPGTPLRRVPTESGSASPRRSSWAGSRALPRHPGGDVRPAGGRSPAVRGAPASGLLSQNPAVVRRSG